MCYKDYSLSAERRHHHHELREPKRVYEYVLNASSMYTSDIHACMHANSFWYDMTTRITRVFRCAMFGMQNKHAVMHTYVCVRVSMCARDTRGNDRGSTKLLALSICTRLHVHLRCSRRRGDSLSTQNGYTYTSLHYSTCMHKLSIRSITVFLS
jgi:hypothetical protein